MIHTHTMSQLKTVQEPMKLLSSTNIGITSSSTYTANLPQTAQPVSANPVIIIPNTSLNYLKIVPVVKDVVTSPNFKVTGWNKCVNSAGVVTHWVPQCLFSSSSMTKVTAGSSTFTVNGETYQRFDTIVKSQGDGKVFNATSILDTAFVLVDTLGCELIEVEFLGAGASPTYNAFYGAI